MLLLRIDPLLPIYIWLRTIHSIYSTEYTESMPGDGEQAQKATNHTLQCCVCMNETSECWRTKKCGRAKIPMQADWSNDRGEKWDREKGRKEQ